MLEEFIMKTTNKLFLTVVFFFYCGSVFSQFPNVNVTNDCWYMNEPSVAINPVSPDSMVCGYNDGTGLTYGASWSWSGNGGRSWAKGGSFSPTGYNRGGDPVIAFDTAGTAYFVSLAFNTDATAGSNGKDGSIYFAKSSDGGRTFNINRQFIETGSDKNPYLDKPWLYVNPFNNDIYIAYVRIDNAWDIGGAESRTIWFSRSSDGGQNFSTPVKISNFSPATNTNRSHGPQITALSANQVFVSWHTREEGNPPTTPWKLWITESLDGGAIFGTNQPVLNSVWGLPNRFISMDSDPASGRIYIAYADSPVRTPREYNIYVTSASSASGPWSTAVKISDDLTGRFQSWPSLDIAPNGRVDVMWYDGRDYLNKTGVYYTSSIDGINWDRNKRVTDLPTGFTPSTDPFAGDYSSISSRNEKVQIAWMDNRRFCYYPDGSSGYSQEIYTSTVIKPVDSLCLPPHRGVPGDRIPPHIDGKVQEDVGWRGAYRITHGSGTNKPHVAFQTLKHETDDFIYLSFEVRNDPTFDDDDVIVLNFRPDISKTAYANDRRIVIYPLCDNNGAGGSTCGTTTPDDKIDQLPRLIKYYKNSSFWSEIEGGINNCDVKVRSHTDGSSKAWYLEIKVPTSTGRGGGQWVNFADEFLFYYNVLRVMSSPTGDITSEFRWPLEAPEVNGDLNLYPFYPWEWGKANKSNTAKCNGVYFGSYSDIGTTNTPTSKIGFTPLSSANTVTNTFYANVRNNTKIGSVPQQANKISVLFRVANWGIPSYADWNTISAANPGCPDLTDNSNPTCLKDIPAAGSGIPGTETFNLKWLLSDDERTQYQANQHQCILAEIDSWSDSRISTKSIYRNMDFGQASVFTRTAQISAKGYGAPPSGASHDFLVNVSTKEFTYGGGYSFDTLALGKLLNKKQFDEKKPVSVLNYTAHGYRYSGRSVIINEKKYDIVDPVGSFGYVVSHRGLVEGWKHELTGTELIGENLYRSEIPPEEKAEVVTIIRPIEKEYKWMLSIHIGSSIPTGNMANDYKPGLSAVFDVDYHFSKNLALVGLIGFSNFKSNATSIPDNYWINTTLNLRYIKTFNSPWSLYVGAGPGYYFPKSGDSEFGSNIGLGTIYELNQSINFELGADYHALLNSNYQFTQLHLGLIIKF